MIDLEKEREAFSNWFGSSFTNGKVEFDNDGVPLGYEKAIAWSAWKTAKSQVPEGFVLVPKEPTWGMIDAGENACYGDDEEICKIVYKAMIEAAQGEGYE